MADYRRNHYVPEWYQHRFIFPGAREKKFYYLDLAPQQCKSNAHRYTRKDLLRWGPDRCFYVQDLYTTRFGDWESTEIEQEFFGKIDSDGQKAVDYFSSFEHPSADTEAFHALLRYMSVQKLRTPKGLANLSQQTDVADKNNVLFAMQELQHIHNALWTESVWTIADASACETKFIISDHPVTVYNRACFPASKWCRGNNDPSISLSATHTFFPLSIDRLLILTNLNWARNPYSNPTAERPNSVLFRPAIFNFLQIQTGRMLDEEEVLLINYVTKMRAKRYLAAARRDWLYPERQTKIPRWDKLGDGYLFMPDPRSVTFTTGFVIGYRDGRGEAFDAYGRRPQDSRYRAESGGGTEWNAFLKFQGEFARRFGPRRRGRSFEGDRLDPEEDSPEFHAMTLRQESRTR